MEDLEDGQTIPIGELAERSGVSVRTLQYYDRIGLLEAGFSEGGRRRYTRDDALRLQQILALRSFGLPLKQIKGRMLTDAASLEEVFARQREVLVSQIDGLNRTVDMLDTIIGEVRVRKEVSAEKLMAMMELMKQGNPYTFALRYFSDDEFGKLGERFASQEAYAHFMGHAEKAFAQMDALYAQGADPAGEEAQKLAARWWDMVLEFTRGDASLLESLLSVGADMGNWPAGTKGIQEAIGQFLVEALGVYFQRNGIELPTTRTGGPNG